jgi:acyl phosphate:glycerol-3-phosphate acyltransferase
MPFAAILLGYLLGSIPFGLLLTRASGLGDIRAIGSGNIGATNVLRTGKRGLAAATLLLDGGKGAAAVLIAAWLWGAWAAPWAALGAVLGHMFPVWLAFRGGKGVATGLGVLLAAFWPVGVIACATWLVVAKLVRISSAGALAAFATAPIAALAFHRQALALVALVIAALIFLRHSDNIRRLLAGTEPRIGEKA